MSARLDARVLQRLRDQVRSTPGRLWAAGGTIWLAVLASVAGHRRGMQTIGKDAAPSIIAAQQIKASLADLHSQAANLLLGKPGQNPQAAKLYEERRREATEGILAAAGNITYG